MIRNSLFCLLFFALAIGCVSMPEPVNDSLLVDQTKEDEARMKVLEEAIVKKKIDIDGNKDNVKKSEHQVNLSKTELAVLTKKRSLLVEEQKLASLKEDQTEAESFKGKIQTVEKQMQKQKMHLAYRELYRDNETAIARVKDSELAVLVAELNHDKAKIARQYQDKKLKEQGKAKEEPSFFSKIFGGSGDDGINLEEYKSYFDVTKNRLKSDQENQKILENRMNQAEKDYNSFVVDDAGGK